MGLKEELLAIDTQRYADIRREVEEEWEHTHFERREAIFMARVEAYPVLATEAKLAIASAAAWDGGTTFGSQETGASRESLVGAVSLIRYAEIVD